MVVGNWRKTRKEMAALSSRARVGTNGVSYVYKYGDFCGNPEKLLLKYFDIMCRERVPSLYDDAMTSRGGMVGVVFFLSIIYLLSFIKIKRIIIQPSTLQKIFSLNILMLQYCAYCT